MKLMEPMSLVILHMMIGNFIKECFAFITRTPGEVSFRVEPDIRDIRNASHS